MANTTTDLPAEAATRNAPTPTPASVPALRELALLRDLDANDRLALDSAGKTSAIGAGTAIIEQGHRHDSLFVVLAGKFEVTREEMFVAEISVGQICGEMEMLNPPHATATVTAVTEGVVWRLSREQLREFMETHPKAGAALMKLMAQTFATRL